jgi:hypothetical protein
MNVIGRIALGFVMSLGAVLLALPVPFVAPAQAAAATCTSSVGPGIAPPAFVPSGLPGFHASWYGQSGYPTLCPGEFSSAVVAYYNSGSRGWQSGKLGEMAFLGTWNPAPGQDRASALGGDGTNGSPATGWPRFNRVAAQPAPWVGPNQVSWFRFTIRAPTTIGTYRLYIRPLIEAATWMEDFGVFWQVTVKDTDAAEGNVGSQTVVVGTVNTADNSFTSGSVTFRYDTNDAYRYAGTAITLAQFEQVLSSGDTVAVNYIPNSSGASTFNITNDVGRGAPGVNATVGSFDGGSTQNDVRLVIFEPSTNADGITYSVQRATVAATASCSPGAGTYSQIALVTIPNGADSTAYVDANRLSGTYCYRAGANNPVTGTTNFGYGNSATIANPPTPVASATAPTSLDARVVSNAGSNSLLDTGDIAQIAFSEPISSAATGATIRARDADGTVADLVCGTNATCTLNTSAEVVGGQSRAPQTVLTVRLTANPVIIVSGSTATLRIPSTVIDRAAITDLSGNPWDLDGSADVVIGSPD